MYSKCILASDVHLPTVVLIVVPPIVPRIVHLGIVHLVSVEIHRTTVLFVSLVIVVGHTDDTSSSWSTVAVVAFAATSIHLDPILGSRQQ